MRSMYPIILGRCPSGQREQTVNLSGPALRWFESTSPHHVVNAANPRGCGVISLAEGQPDGGVAQDPGATCGAKINGDLFSTLGRVAEAWPELPAHIREAILALVGPFVR